jgi:hypothetical protein
MQTSFEFQPEYATKLFINANGGITITQEEDGTMVVISSKKRAMELARVIRHLASLATWEPKQEDS